MLNWSLIPSLKEWKLETYSGFGVCVECFVGRYRRLRRQDEGAKEGNGFDAGRLDREDHDAGNQDDWRPEEVVVRFQFGGGRIIVPPPPIFLPVRPAHIWLHCSALLRSVK